MVYTTEPFGALVNKDTDEDGILDWEESLWGTDPTRQDSDDDGISDSAEITKLKSESGTGEESLAADSLKLTETEKFADQLFATTAALNEGGVVDENTLNSIGTSLAENIQKTTQRKVYTVKNIQISKDESVPAIRAYGLEIQSVQAKHPLDTDVAAIAATAIRSDGEIDATVFKKFDPTISQINGIVKDMLAIKPPYSVSTLHVMVINRFQKLSENLEDIKLAEADPIIALKAIEQYENNSATLFQYITILSSYLSERLNN